MPSVCGNSRWSQSSICVYGMNGTCVSLLSAGWYFVRRLTREPRSNIRFGARSLDQTPSEKTGFLPAPPAAMREARPE